MELGLFEKITFFPPSWLKIACKMGLLLGGIVPMFGETNANGEVLVDLYQ